MLNTFYLNDSLFKLLCVKYTMLRTGKTYFLCVLIILVLKIYLEMFLFLKHYSSELLSMLPGIHRGQCGGVWPLGCWNSV